MQLRWLVCLCTLLSAAITQEFQAHPILLSQHINAYETMTLEDMQHSAPSQIFPNMLNASIRTAFQLVIGADPIYDLRGFEFDFVLGRRPIQGTVPFDFHWELTSLTVPIGMRLQVYDNCDPSLKMPCSLIKETSLMRSDDVPSMYTYKTLSWGNVYRASLILPINPATNQSLVIAPPVTENVAVYWIVLSIVLDSQSSSTNYEYIARLPVTPSTDGVLLVYDALNLLGHGWTNWTNPPAVGDSFFGNVQNPMIGYRVAAYASVTNNGPSSTPNNETIPQGPFVFPPNVATDIPSPAFDFINGTQVTNNGVLMTVGFVVASLLFFVIVIAIVYVIVRIRRRRRHAYNSVDAGPDDPLDDSYSEGSEPFQDVAGGNSTHEYGPNKGQATRPLGLVGSHNNGAPTQYNASGELSPTSPRGNGRMGLSTLLEDVTLNS